MAEDRAPDCGHDQRFLTTKGCTACIGHLAASLVMARWREALGAMSDKECEERSQEIANSMQEQVLIEVQRIMGEPVSV